MKGSTHSINAPHFNAGIVTYHNVVREAAPILHYMEGWHLTKVREYCRKKGWTLTEAKEQTMNNSILVGHDQYYDMLDKVARYEALRAAGVDNWEGYAPAMKALSEANPAATELAAEVAQVAEVRPDAAVDTEAPKA